MSEQLNFEDEAIPITLRRAWDRALRLLATRVNKPTFEAHIRTLRPVSLTEDGEVTLGVPSAFTREWVEKRHAPLIKNLLEEILDKDLRLRFLLLPKEGTDKGLTEGPPVSPPPPVPATPATAAAAAQAEPAESDADSALFQLTPDTGGAGQKMRPAASAAPAPGGPPPAKKPHGEPPPPPPPAVPRKSDDTGSSNSAPMLNPRYTFESFVVGPSNRLAQAGAWAVAQAPGHVYNPLFLYGPSGLGKTHLMHAIGNTIASGGAGAAMGGGQAAAGSASSGGSGGRIAYISGESFLTHYVTSLRERRTEEFRRRWRSVDVLLVDDIQFIAGKEHTKEEFFHTFNALSRPASRLSSRRIAAPVSYG